MGACGGSSVFQGAWILSEEENLAATTADFSTCVSRHSEDASRDAAQRRIWEFFDRVPCPVHLKKGRSLASWRADFTTPPPACEDEPRMGAHQYYYSSSSPT